MVVKDEFKDVQPQTAWLAKELVKTNQDLSQLWVQFLRERQYHWHMIEEHLLPLQLSLISQSCQCRVVGNLPYTGAPSLSSSEVGLKCSASQPSLKSVSNGSCDTLWEELQDFDRKATLSSQQQEGGSLNEVEASDEEADSEAWEDCNDGGSGGGSSGGEGDSDAWRVWVWGLFPESSFWPCDLLFEECVQSVPPSAHLSDGDSLRLLGSLGWCRVIVLCLWFFMSRISLQTWAICVISLHVRDTNTLILKGVAGPMIFPDNQ